MRYRKLDENGDYTLGTGADFFVNNRQAVAQAVLTRLRLFQGEWFLDLSAGMPWATGVLGKYTQPTYDALIKDQILGTQGVLAITKYSSSLDPAERALTVSVDYDTIYGPVSTETTL